MGELLPARILRVRVCAPVSSSRDCARCPEPPSRSSHPQFGYRTARDAVGAALNLVDVAEFVGAVTRGARVRSPRGINTKAADDLPTKLFLHEGNIPMSFQFGRSLAGGSGPDDIAVRTGLGAIRATAGNHQQSRLLLSASVTDANSCRNPCDLPHVILLDEPLVHPLRHHTRERSHGRRATRAEALRIAPWLTQLSTSLPLPGLRVIRTPA
jgi:hypothetical protein